MIRMARIRFIALAGSAAAVAVGLSGCDVIGIDPHRYDDVKAVVDRLALSSTGTITKEQYYGGGASGAPCYLALITGGDAYERISGRLERVGFLTSDGAYWQWSSESGERVVSLNHEGPGDMFPMPNGDSYPVERAGAMVHVC